MFYRESYNCIMYKSNPDLIEKFDFFVGTLVGDIANKITPSLVVEKLGIHYEVAKQILYYYEEKGILQRMYAILCPNTECRQIQKIVPKEDLIEELRDMRDVKSCFACDEEMEEIGEEDIFLLYRRILLSTTSQDEVNETLIKHNVISSEILTTDNFFVEADSLSLDDIYDFYFKLDESAKNVFKERIKKLDAKTVYDTTTEKGNALEDLCLDLLSYVKIFEVSRKYRTKTNQLDVTVKAPIKFSAPSILDELSPYFICECKNESGVPGNTYYHKLYSIVESTDAKVGILFSIKSCARTCNDIAREKYLLSRKKIINITKADLKKVIDGEINIFVLLKEKIDAVSINAITGLKEKGLDYK